MEARLSLDAFQRRFRVRKVVGDGTCLFHSVSKAARLAGHNVRNGHALRSRAADYLLMNKSCYRSRIPENMTLAEYALGIRRGNWGDEIEVSILSKLLGFQIELYDVRGAEVHMYRYRGGPRSRLIRIVRTGGSHYDALTERARKCRYSADCPAARPNCRSGRCITNAEYLGKKEERKEVVDLAAARRTILDRERVSGKRDLAARREFNAAMRTNRRKRKTPTCRRSSDCPPTRPNCHQRRCITNREYLRIGELAREAELTRRDIALIERLSRAARDDAQKVPQLSRAVERIAAREKNKPSVLDSIIALIARALSRAQAAVAY